jgi:AcrR family transcriptional regulator
MARRLAPEERRAEILARTRELIAVQGPEGLSLRSVARWCGLTAPGVLHHFEGGLKQLLEELLAQRDAEELAAATAFVASLGPEGTLQDFADGLVRHFAAEPAATRNFDALEVQAVASPDHPAHDYFLHQIVRPLPPAVELAARDYAEPEQVVELLGLVADGLRHRWLRADGVPDYWADWARVRDAVFAGFERRERPPVSPS